ncbi:hypothetical protein N7466_007446 [Penicillium verhagenii]|uniref:uncharacterized protein n=1 Tax=Penicillium verhagenii TaxID=1562060 RepID=UPI0025458DEB|nr:uncharacterized protein N7466_007446 [Penicillium verhagenii]KAJ5928490.1 hypothetical protein N7466_007446 [Penicillium verhagenii]
MTAFEQAGSLFTGWIGSCLSYLSPGEKGQAALSVENKGVKREMQVCHAQPHLVPPMQLRVYDDLPDPRIHHTRNSQSLSSWLEEGRNLASRASNRASLIKSRRRLPITPLEISSPSDFLIVDSSRFHETSLSQHFVHTLTDRAQPLETSEIPKTYELVLSIHQDKNRLSDLPSFESFQLVEDRQYQYPMPAVPARALSQSSIRHRRYVSTASARKPVGSGDRRSLGNPIEPAMKAEPHKPASSLVPHFSVVTPRGPLPMSILAHSRTHSEESKLTLDTDILSDNSSDAQTPRAVQDLPQTPVTPTGPESTIGQHSPNESSFFRDSPSTSSSSTFPSRLSSLRRPSFTPSDYRKTVAAVPLPDRVSQWFSRENATPPKPISLDGENAFEWERTRTLSGTTVCSTITTTITGGAKSRPSNLSISSSFMGSSTPRASLHQPSLNREKDIVSDFYQPTAYEGRQQRPAFPSSRHGDPVTFPESAIGVAF